MATIDSHADCSRVTWRKSTRSSANGECVEVAAVAGAVAVRDSKDPRGAVLMVSRDEWRGFIRRVADGAPLSR
jgi:hypothetical protein